MHCPATECMALKPSSCGFLSFKFELLEQRQEAVVIISCMQCKQFDYYAPMGTGALPHTIMDLIVHNAFWGETGRSNLCVVYARSSRLPRGVSPMKSSFRAALRPHDLACGSEPKYWVAPNGNNGWLSTLRIFMWSPLSSNSSFGHSVRR